MGIIDVNQNFQENCLVWHWTSKIIMELKNHGKTNHYKDFK